MSLSEGRTVRDAPWSPAGGDASSLRLLGVLHLLADLVAEDLVPVYLGAGDWELSA